MLQIRYLKCVESTQNYLKSLIKNNEIEIPHAVIADVQTNGIGSRGNSWSGLEGNLFLSFAISLDMLPKDLKLESSSIYFAYILKETLESFGSKVWLKWPNDFYMEDTKIGGMITNVTNNTLICGVGLNLVKAPESFARLDVDLDKKELVEIYLKNIEKKFSWKQVFSKYKLEFGLNQKFFTHSNNEKVSLEDAILESDGSITCGGERIFSLR